MNRARPMAARLKNNEAEEIKRIFNLMEKNDEQIRIIEEQHGSNLEMQSEIEKLKKTKQKLSNWN